MKFAVRGARVPVVKVEVKKGGSWVAGQTAPHPGGGFYIFSSGPFSFPLDVRLTSYTGEKVTDKIPKVENDKKIQGSSQFSGGGGGEMEELWPGTGKRCTGPPDTINGKKWGNLGEGVTAGECKSRCAADEGCTYATFKASKCSR